MKNEEILVAKDFRLFRSDLIGQQNNRHFDKLSGEFIAGVQVNVEALLRMLQSMNLTADLINSASSFVNELGQRQLNLRGRGLTAITNSAMSSTLNYYQSIDLSDNNIQVLNNLSYLDRLKTLNVANNKIKYIYGLANSVPNLENLILLGNRIEDFSELFPLSNCKKLKRLVLIDNPVTEKIGYKAFIISNFKSLTYLDFRKVTKQDRLLAERANLKK